MIVLLLSLVSVVQSVVELSGDSLELSEGAKPHLVLFYAPWCGHCRALHPIWHQISDKLSNKNIVTAKCDATVYRGAAEKFNVKGFPAIRLIGHDRVLDYHGDRTYEDLSDFAVAGSRPFLMSMGSLGKLNDLRKTEDVIFSLKSPTPEMKLCSNIAVTHIIHQTLITEVNNEIFLPVSSLPGQKVNNVTELRPDHSISRSPGFAVFKDDLVLEYTGDLEDCIAMSAWIFSERFAALQKGSYPVIHPLLFLSSKIVFLYSEQDTPAYQAKLSEMRAVSNKRVALAAYGDNMYFIHVDQAEYLENLVSGYVESPSVVIFDPLTEVYTYTTNLTIGIEQLVSDFTKGKTPVWGGGGVANSFKKVWFRIHSTVWPLFTDHPFIMMICLCIPIGLISLCCWDEMRSKNDPIRKICEDKSEMDMLFGDDVEYEDRSGEVEEEERDSASEDSGGEEEEEKEPGLKKDE